MCEETAMYVQLRQLEAEARTLPNAHALLPVVRCITYGTLSFVLVFFISFSNNVFVTFSFLSVPRLYRVVSLSTKTR